MKVIELDYSKHCCDEPEKGHNRWHPDIPPAAKAEPGQEIPIDAPRQENGLAGLLFEGLLRKLLR